MTSIIFLVVGVEDYRMQLNCIPSESVTIYTGGVLRDKPTNPTISLEINLYKARDNRRISRK